MRRLAPFLLLALIACEHSGVAAVAPGVPDGPFDPSVPTRLTYSATGDRPTPGIARAPGNREVSWTPDGASIVYAFGDIVRATGGGTTGCVGMLPAAGGSRSLTLCDREVARIDSGTTTEWPAMRDNSEIAFVRRRFGPYSGFPYYSDFAIQRTAPGEIARSIFTFPQYSPTTGELIQGIAFPRWIDHDRLLALARKIRRRPTDLLQTGLEIVLIEPAKGAAALTVVPGTLDASSVTTGATADTIYYTLGGDSRVYRRTLAGGTIDTVFDFGVLGIARDVQVGPGLLIAIVGGGVGFGPDSLLGMAQADSGGRLYHVAFATGVATLLGTSLDYWQHPALAPDASAVIVEQAGELWRIPLP
jgi:hypothetical protein